MEPGFRPRWTKEDTRLCVQMGLAFPAFSALLGFLSGEGVVWGALGGIGLWAIITIGALVKIAFGSLRR